ncbi:hypothetical protein LOC71_03010 [Rhodopirellula sp. JC740]|uniref:Uncharacterized protein n=2 Tax=Rhodopirellula halodulae TaxID=2894198 RepID=A0ABS8NCV5_9BACT|nr:hypothetical protein [Rhodopirellula sp. JC740]
MRPWSKKRGRRSRTGAMRGVLGELAFYLGLILLGVFVLALVVVSSFMMPHINLNLPEEARRVLELESNLTQGGNQWGRWVVAIVSVASIASGVTGLAYRLLHLGFSQERLSAGKKRAIDETRSLAGRDSIAEEGLRGRDADWELQDFPELPTVPKRQMLNESPGERLAYRLASVSTGRMSLFGTAALALGWNSLCLVLLAVVVSGWWYDMPRPILAMLMVPFSCVAVWSLRVFLKQVRQIAGVGATVVEISDHPLQPGGQYELFVSQMGKMRLKWLKIELVCEEESFFRQGTDVRSDHHVAMRQELVKEKSVRVDPRGPWEQQLTFELPDNVMHSFAATNNVVRWRLLVSGESRPWPSFCRSFPLLVHPPLMSPPDSPR